MQEWIEEIQHGLPGSLVNTSRLCELLKNPQNSFKSLHIAGTNGKGSVTKKCCAGLMESGFKVGMYTSPHISDYTERIQINFEPIPKLLFFQYSEIIKSLVEEERINIGWFDLYTVVCFLYFSEMKVDYACIEVGVGGRLDNTNVIMPLIDHIKSV